jgi:phosphatidylglycerophosphate synthase
MCQDEKVLHMKLPPMKEFRERFGKHDAQGLILRACDWVVVYPGRLFLYLPFTPNQITVIWILMKTIAALVVGTGNYWASIIAMLFFFFGSILDGVDGVVARYRKHYSLNGIYLDLIGHYFCNSLLLITLGIGAYRLSGDPYLIVAGGLAAWFFLLAKSLSINLAWYNNLEQRAKVDELLYRNKLGLQHAKNKWITFLFDFTRLDNPFNLLFWGIVLDVRGLTIWAYAALFFLELVRKLFMQFWRIYKNEMRERAEK